MNPDRTTPATLGDLDDVKVELKADIQDLRVELKADIHDLRAELKADIHDLRAELKAELGALEERLTRSTAMELGRVANVIMEHTTSLIRATGDHPKAIEERLDAHIADTSVHRGA